AQEVKVIERFNADRDEQYAEFIGRCDDFEAEIAKEIAKKKFTYAELGEEDTDLKKLQGWLEKINKLDFYGATRAAEAAQRLEQCPRFHDYQARQVFEANDENHCRLHPPGNRQGRSCPHSQKRVGAWFCLHADGYFFGIDPRPASYLSGDGTWHVCPG